MRARRGVVLTTGGFIYNDKMLAQHSPAMLGVSKLGHGGQDGLGIQMAQATGADAIHMDTADITLVLTPPMSYARGILFNALGRRFINEDTYYGRLGAEAAFRQDTVAYLLLDESTFLEQLVAQAVVGRGLAGRAGDRDEASARRAGADGGLLQRARGPWRRPAVP